MRIPTLPILIASIAYTYATNLESTQLDERIIAIPLDHLDCNEHGGGSPAPESQMKLLEKTLEMRTGKAIVSYLDPVVVSDLSQVHFDSASYILAGLRSQDRTTTRGDYAWIVKNSNDWQHALNKSINAEQNVEWYIQAVELSSSASSQKEDKFCDGMPMVMSMSGFQWSLERDDTKPDCLNYFVPLWKLDDRGRFIGAMVYSFLLGMMTEAITNFQIWIRPSLGTGRLRKFTMPLLYAIQQWLGYIIMIVAMMYSIELFASLLLGLVLGRLLFLPRSLTKPIVQADTSPPVDDTGVTLAAIPESEETPLVNSRS